MIVREIADKYSKALFRQADSEHQLESVQQSLDQAANFVSSPELQSFFSSPSVNAEKKKELLKQFLGDINPLVVSFLEFLIDKSRFEYLAEINQHYSQLVKAATGVIDVELVTVVPADQSTKETLKAKLEQLYQKKITIKETIDEQIIGGMIVIVGNQMLDYSVRGRLARLKDDLLAHMLPFRTA